MKALLPAGFAVLLLVLTPSPAAADPPSPDQAIDQAVGQLATVIEKYDQAREQLKGTKAKVAALTGQLGPLRARVADLSFQVAELAASLYKGGSLAGANALLATKSPAEIAERLMTVDQLAARQYRQIRDLNKAKTGLEKQLRTLDQVLDTQTRAERDIATRKATIEQQLNELTTARWGDARSSRAEPRDSYVPPYRAGKSGSVVQFAYRAIGSPYIFGSDGPSGYDCSGLVLAAWRSAGINLPHSAAMQRDATERIGAAELRPGDLIFYFDDLHHVGIFAGAGRVIHAPQPGERIKMAPMNQMPIHSYGRPRGAPAT
ncbi:NlpC/P60 family protein [Longispora albida]|uniref:C40 family peptidase n=1 Tax=Longispora albida TaxID=203523 RepID=UPI000381545B|nr:NlpC/P60 family protein [Longispora albida]